MWFKKNVIHEFIKSNMAVKSWKWLLFFMFGNEKFGEDDEIVKTTETAKYKIQQIIMLP